MATGTVKNKQNKQKEEKDYRKLISQQKDQLASLSREINVAESRILESSKVPGGILKSLGKHKHYRKRIRILESKCNQGRIKFDELQWSNRNYQEDIVYLQNLSRIVSTIEEALNKQRTGAQKTLEQLEERLNLTISQRSEAKTRMLETKEDIEVETFHFTKTLTQMNSVINQDLKISTFIEKKCEERPLEDSKDSVKREKQQQQYEDKVAMLEMNMKGHKALLEVTGEKDLQRIGLKFILNEHQNFVNFKHINELHDKRNALRKCMEKMKHEIISLEQENKGHDEQSKSQLEDLQSELERQSSLADSLEKQYAVVTLDELKSEVSGFLDELMPEVAAAVRGDITNFSSVLKQSIDLMIQANSVEDEERELDLQEFSNFNLLPECKAAVQERSRSTSRSLKSALSD